MREDSVAALAEGGKDLKVFYTDKSSQPGVRGEAAQKELKLGQSPIFSVKKWER